MLLAFCLSQALSSRPDIMPPSYLSELEKLQDQIPPFPDEEARKVLVPHRGWVKSMCLLPCSQSMNPIRLRWWHFVMGSTDAVLSGLLRCSAERV